MASLHRIQWLDQQIRANLFPNASGLSMQFEISRRQAQRDLDYLRDSLGAPMQYCGKRRGFFYTDTTFTLPGVMLTEEQQQVLMSLAVHYEGLSANQGSAASETLSELARLLSKLSGERKNIAKNGLPIYKPEDGVTPFIAVLQNAGSWHKPIAPSLKPYFRGYNHDRAIICEFYHSKQFLPALLSAGSSYELISPLWLREKLLQHLERVRCLHI